MTRPTPETVRAKLQQAREAEEERLAGDLNDFLGEHLARINERDTQLVSDRLADVQEVLSDAVEVDSILLGGSVAKHTAVSGLSDVDALAILNREDLAGKSADEVLAAFGDELDAHMPRHEVAEVRVGTLAVTVVYKDGEEIQLLPALRSGSTVSIPASDGKGWNATKPQEFRQELSAANRRLNGALVPAIKLMKSINADLPEQKQLTGYHIEALAVDASKGYRGEKTARAVLLHILGHASERVARPIKDVTEQTRVVDGYLGETDSVARRNCAMAFGAMRRRLERARSVSQWESVFGKP